MAAALLRETTTIGVRRIPVTRTERPRRTITVATAFGPIPVKISEGPFGPPQIKPEFDECAAAARDARRPGARGDRRGAGRRAELNQAGSDARSAPS